MTTPNIEELIADLQQLANEIEISHRIEAIEESVKALQSQAERIAELEYCCKTAGTQLTHWQTVIDEKTTEIYTLRAQLAAIAATEPVAWLYTAHDGSVQAFTNEPPQRLKELCKPVFNRAISPVRREPMSDGALIDAVANSIAEATHPMPAQDVKDAERYRWLREQHWSTDTIAVVLNPKQAVKLGYVCPSDSLLDETIDAAIAKGAK